MLTKTSRGYTRYISKNNSFFINYTIFTQLARLSANTYIYTQFVICHIIPLSPTIIPYTHDLSHPMICHINTLKIQAKQIVVHYTTVLILAE